MRKEYITADIEIVKLNFTDVISTSGEGPIEPGHDPSDLFNGGYDPDGWT